MNETAAAGLGALVKARRCVNIVYMDDGHTFEDKITEIAFSYRLLRLGGVLARACRPSNPRVRISPSPASTCFSRVAVHDAGLAAVQKAVMYATRNLGFRSINVTQEAPNLMLLVKWHPDRPHSPDSDTRDSFVDF